MPCSILCMLPAAYYLAARFQEDFEQAVLHAVNGGGAEYVQSDAHRRPGGCPGRFVRHPATVHRRAERRPRNR
jgi:hypothetical protein